MNLTDPIASATVSPAELIAHRGYLVRFAQRHLADPLLAEDAVHDVFEAVLAGRASFGGRSALRSWLTGVLKHKIVDQIRRSPFAESLDAADDDDEAAPGMDIESTAPAPDRLAELREQVAQTLDRIAGLPATLRDAVQLRLIEDRTTAEVCATLSISEENLFVRLHRARKALAH